MRQYYRPPKKAGKYSVACFILLAFATASAILGFELKKSLFYALSLALFFFSVQVFTVYILPTYEYGIDGGIFSIYRSTGKKRICIYDLDLNYAVKLLRYPEAKKHIKEKGKPKRRFYCLCGVQRKKCSVLFYDTDTSFALYFAPNETFFEIVDSYIR